MNEKVNVDFGKWIQKGFDIWKDNLLTLIISCVIAISVGVLSLGVLGGTMGAGLIQMVLAMHDDAKPKPQISDLFKGFSFFLPTFLYFLIFVGFFLVLSLIGKFFCIGPLLALTCNLVFNAVMMFTLFNLVDKKMSLIDAMKASAGLVLKSFFPFLGLAIVAFAIGAAGAFICIGIFATMPISVCILAAAYRGVERGSVTETPPTTPPPSPTPPPTAPTAPA